MGYYLNLFNNGGSVECSCINKNIVGSNIEVEVGDKLEILYQGVRTEATLEAEHRHLVLKTKNETIRDIQGIDVERVLK